MREAVKALIIIGKIGYASVHIFQRLAVDLLIWRKERVLFNAMLWWEKQPPIEILR